RTDHFSSVRPAPRGGSARFIPHEIQPRGGCRHAQRRLTCPHGLRAGRDRRTPYRSGMKSCSGATKATVLPSRPSVACWQKTNRRGTTMKKSAVLLCIAALAMSAGAHAVVTINAYGTGTTSLDDNGTVTPFDMQSVTHP